MKSTLVTGGESGHANVGTPRKPTALSNLELDPEPA